MFFNNHGERFSPPEDRVSGGDPFQIDLFIACKWGLLFFSDNLPGFSKDCKIRSILQPLAGRLLGFILKEWRDFLGNLLRFTLFPTITVQWKIAHFGD